MLKKGTVRAHPAVLKKVTARVGFSRSWRSFFFHGLFFFESDFFKKPKNCQEKKLVSQEVFLAFFLKVERIKIIPKDKNFRSFCITPEANI